MLGRFNAAGVIEAADAHTARRIQALAGEPDDEVALALALTVRSLRHGSVCLDLGDLVAEALPDGPGVAGRRLGRPGRAPAGWRRPVCCGSRAAVTYLDRYWREECQVRDDLAARLALATARGRRRAPRGAGAGAVPAGVRRAARAPRWRRPRQWTTVLTGGPGTGKTTAVAGLLALLADQSDRRLRIALTAPTGKAAARLQEAVRTALAEPRLRRARRGGR